MKEFSDQQRRLLQRVAEGLATKTEIAREINWHPGSVSRFLARPEARAELLRLREEAERQFAERLPALVDKALAVLERALDCKHNPDRQLEAARFTLRLAEKLATKSEGITPNSTASHVINLPIAPQEL